MAHANATSASSAPKSLFERYLEKNFNNRTTKEQAEPATAASIVCTAMGRSAVIAFGGAVRQDDKSRWCCRTMPNVTWEEREVGGELVEEAVCSL